MEKSTLVKIFGFGATLVHGDTLVMDRWRWLKKRLPITNNCEKLIDVGCGTGSFTIGAAKRGYTALGLSWDERNQEVAGKRAAMCKSPEAVFEVADVRQLDERDDLHEKFDIAICFEVTEHILNDKKLIQDISRCLKPGGRLLLTTPYYHYKAINSGDNGPFITKETGWHVRRGYTSAMLTELCEHADLRCEEISYCGGYVSQKITGIFWWLSPRNFYLGWLAVFPLRIIPFLTDNIIARLFKWPCYSICMEAYKPRFSKKTKGKKELVREEFELVNA